MSKVFSCAHGLSGDDGKKENILPITMIVVYTPGALESELETPRFPLISSEFESNITSMVVR